MAKTTGNDLPVLVLLKPGTSAEKALTFKLPKNLDNSETSVDRVIEYGMTLREQDGIKREGLRIQERIRTERTGKYGISVNGKGSYGSEPLAPYLKTDKTPAGKDYHKAEIIVAARQEGASLDSLI